MPVAPRKKKPARWIKWTIGFVSLVILYTIGGFFIAPAVIRSQAKKIIEAQTGLEVEVGRIKVNPYALTLTLEEFSAAPPGEPDWVTLNRLHANLQIASLFRSDYLVKEVRLDSPALFVQWNEDGRINLMSLLDNLPESTNTEPFAIPGVRIDQLSISDAAVRWQDDFLKTGFEARVDDVHLSLTNFYSLGTNAFQLQATLDEETDVGANGTFSIEPIAAHVHADVEALLLERYAAYLPEWSTLQLTGGRVNTSIDATAAFTDGELSAAVSNGNVQVTELALFTADDEQAVLEIDDVSVSGAGADLESYSAMVADVSVSGVRLKANRLADGSIDWIERVNEVMANLPESTNTEPFAIPGVRIDQLSISDAAVRWQDDFLKTGFEARVDDVHLSLTNFYSLGTNAFQLQATLDEETDVGANGTFSIEPIAAHVHADVEALLLERYAAYLPEWSTLQLTGGRVNTSIDATAAFTDGELSAAVSNGNVQVTELALFTADDEQAVLEIDDVSVSGAGADLESYSAMVADVSVSGVRLKANRLADGSIDWIERVNEVMANLPESTNTEPANPWEWSVGKFSADNANVTITDHAVEPGPVSLVVKNASVSVSDLNPDFSGTFPVEVGFELESGGSGTVAGNVTVTPLSADLRVTVDDLFFPVGQPYLDEVLRLQLRDGTVSVDANVSASLGETNALNAAFVGGVQLKDVAVNEEDGEPFATVSHLKIDDLKIDWPIDDFSVMDIFVESPTAFLLVREDGTANVDDIVPRSITEKLAEQFQKAWQLMNFEVGSLVVTNGFVHFEDQSISPNATSNFTNVFASLVGLSAGAEEPARFESSGLILPNAPLKMSATIDASATNVSGAFSLTMRSVQLPPGSGYSGKFAGYLIDQGYVTADLRYTVQGDRVQGENRIVVHEFEFGEKQESEDALKLPVKLGVSLLKDSSGTIDLTVPVSGDLSDPDFRLDKIIWSTVGNVLNKAASAPFKLLGNLVGAGDREDLGSIQFAAGQTELTDDARKKLRKLSQALNKRPALRLEIVGRVDPAIDAEQLRSAQLEEALMELRAQLTQDEELKNLARAFVDPENPRPDELIQLLYVKTFGMDYSTPVKPPADLIARRALEQRTQSRVADEPALIGATSAPRKTEEAFWKRTKNIVTLKPLRSGDPSDELPESEAAVVTPETSTTAEIVVINEPIPVLPSLPSTAEMVAKLKAELSVDETVLAGLANKRAEVVHTFLSTEAGIEENRLQITTELSGPEPATSEAKVFLGIF